jgi:DNA-binding transcriptional LysR family regulator
MQLIALKYFVPVADHGSFSAAARWLGVSTSTLTRSVSALEDDLGLTLFERSRHGVH